MIWAYGHSQDQRDCQRKSPFYGHKIWTTCLSNFLAWIWYASREERRKDGGQSLVVARGMFKISASIKIIRRVQKHSAIWKRSTQRRTFFFFFGNSSWCLVVTSLCNSSTFSPSRLASDLHFDNLPHICVFWSEEGDSWKEQLQVHLLGLRMTDDSHWVGSCLHLFFFLLYSLILYQMKISSSFSHQEWRRSFQQTSISSLPGFCTIYKTGLLFQQQCSSQDICDRPCKAGCLVGEGDLKWDDW